LKTLKELRAKLSSNPAPVTETEARRRLAVAEAKRAEVRNRRDEGELVERAKVQAEWIDIAVQIRNKVLGLPAAIANRLSAESRREVLTVATDEARRILESLSDEIRLTKGDL
jgi:phage terminase Nu1 subunit (DNA packaging protein)